MLYNSEVVSALQQWQTAIMWTNHIYICVYLSPLHLEPPSHLLSYPSNSSQSARLGSCVIQQLLGGYLFFTWLSIYVSATSSIHPLLPSLAYDDPRQSCGNIHTRNLTFINLGAGNNGKELIWLGFLFLCNISFA